MTAIPDTIRITAKTNGQNDVSGTGARSQRLLTLNPQLFSSEQARQINLSMHSTKELSELLQVLTYPQLQNLLDAMVTDAVAYYREYHGVTTNEKSIRNRCENLLDFKERTGCVEPIESCLNEGCSHLRPNCAVRKVQEDIFNVLKIFEARKNRSSVPHVAVELFFKKIMETTNCIGLVLSDKFGTPKVFTTDGSGISPIITEGSRRLSDAILDHEFRFSARGEAYQVFNQKFPVDIQLAARLQPMEKNPDLSRFVRRLTFSSVGFEVAHEKLIFSAIYLGDNRLQDFIERAVRGIERIKLETEPELRFRAGFGKK